MGKLWQLCDRQWVRLDRWIERPMPGKKVPGKKVAASLLDLLEFLDTLFGLLGLLARSVIWLAAHL